MDGYVKNDLVILYLYDKCNLTVNGVAKELGMSISDVSVALKRIIRDRGVLRADMESFFEKKSADANVDIEVAAAELVRSNGMLMGTIGELVYIQDYYDDIEKLMIEFAKMHVKEALKEASEKAVMDQGEYYYEFEINKDSILNAYPESKIK